MTNVLDDLVPSAADCAMRMAEAEAEKASDYMRKEAAAEAEKKLYFSGCRSRQVFLTRNDLNVQPRL